MNTLDIARAFLARTWKFLVIVLTSTVFLIGSLSVLGFGGTLVLLAFLGLYLAVQFKGTEIYFWFTKHASALASKVNLWWAPIWDDITGEAKAVAVKRAKLTSARAARKAARKELKESRKAVKSLAKTAAKALEAQLIAAGNGDDVATLTVDALKARESADTAVKNARLNKARFTKAIAAVILAEVALHDAVKEYRNSKSTEVTAS